MPAEDMSPEPRSSNSQCGQIAVLVHEPIERVHPVQVVRVAHSAKPRETPTVSDRHTQLNALDPLRFVKPRGRLTWMVSFPSPTNTYP